jgi:hypothetical protein
MIGNDNDYERDLTERARYYIGKCYRLKPLFSVLSVGPYGTAFKVVESFFEEGYYDCFRYRLITNGNNRNQIKNVDEVLYSIDSYSTRYEEITEEEFLIECIQ